MAGHYIKLESGKYRVTMDYGIINGERVRKNKNVSTEAEAKKLLNEFEYNQQRNLLVQNSKMTLAEFLEHWMDNYVKSLALHK
ncbi:site-specific integrase, partial [Brevibacillus agri]